MSSVVFKQSATNWRAIKQLYLQGARRPPLPEPTHEDINYRQIQQYASPLLIEMENLYRLSLTELEERAQQSIDKLNQRVLILEKEVNSLRRQKNKQATTANSPSAQSLLEADAEMHKPASLIHIEEEEEQSLLQPETVEKEPWQILQSEMMTVKKQMGIYSTNSKKLFKDISDSRMKYQYSDIARPLSTKESAYFDTTREEMYALKEFIEKAHGIKMQGCFDPPEVTVSVRNLQIQPTKNEIYHLKNENSQLRQQLAKYQLQLQRCQEELEKVRHLLLQGIQEQDYGPYVVCQ